MIECAICKRWLCQDCAGIEVEEEMDEAEEATKIDGVFFACKRCQKEVNKLKQKIKAKRETKQQEGEMNAEEKEDKEKIESKDREIEILRNELEKTEMDRKNFVKKVKDDYEKVKAEYRQKVQKVKEEEIILKRTEQCIAYQKSDVKRQTDLIQRKELAFLLKEGERKEKEEKIKKLETELKEANEKQKKRKKN